MHMSHAYTFSSDVGTEDILDMLKHKRTGACAVKHNGSWNSKTDTQVELPFAF